MKEEEKKEKIEVIFAMTADDDIAVAFGREHVHAERAGGVRLVPLLVEGCAGGGLRRDHHRPAVVLSLLRF